ncbi:hypothetical protein BJ878DRAFT_449329 [Calycina marina]|uniref:Uncharacterized protein n=1 Tax=Calycina marina TaxID=1763456 RepID=A0A9P7YV15_9HELO|nr:hypothetical protein BJ878DRAFT_449329 [Calycina marina]
MVLSDFLSFLGGEIDDVWEEAFLLFSQSIPSQNLGFVDQAATTIEVSIGGRDLLIHQSPTVLSSNRSGGTTGAVVWKITPLVASWLSSPNNFLFKQDVLDVSSSVLELGCGIAGIIGLAVAPRVKTYVLTDQDYVMKLLKLNIARNQMDTMSSNKVRESSSKSKSKGVASPPMCNIMTQPLDWETDEVTPSLTNSKSEKSFDLVLACDCIYNDALIAPLVQTCVDACKMRVTDPEHTQSTLCVVAQQLRSNEVFEGWLKSFHESFHVWRVPDEVLSDGLKSDSGFVVHVGVLREKHCTPS